MNKDQSDKNEALFLVHFKWPRSVWVVAVAPSLHSSHRVKVNVVLMWFIFIYYNIKSQKQWEQKLSTFPTCTMMSFLSRGLPSGHSSPKHRSISYCGGSAVWPRCWQITPTRQERVNTHIRQWHGCKYIWIQKYEWWKIQSLNCWLFQYNPAVNELIN